MSITPSQLRTRRRALGADRQGSATPPPACPAVSLSWSNLPRAPNDVHDRKKDAGEEGVPDDPVLPEDDPADDAGDGKTRQRRHPSITSTPHDEGQDHQDGQDSDGNGDVGSTCAPTHRFAPQILRSAADVWVGGLGCGVDLRERGPCRCGDCRPKWRTGSPGTVSGTERRRNFRASHQTRHEADVRSGSG